MNKPIIICSAGHKYNLANSQDEMQAYTRWLGSKTCPMCTSYDRLAGSTYCNRRLRDIEEVIETEYDKMFTRYLHGNHHWFRKYKTIIPPHGEMNIKQKMRDILLSGKMIRCGKSSTAVRGHYERHIFYK